MIDFIAHIAALFPYAGESIKETATSVVPVTEWFKWELWIDKLIKVGITIVISLPLLKLMCMGLIRLVRNSMSHQAAVLLTRWFWRLGLVLISLTVLKQLGVDLVAVLGAAGIAGVAFAFAAQNSLSNVISGLFLMGERSISLGDFVEIGGIRGKIEEIGILSIILKTLDNRQVRIPNETVLKGTLINITRYPIRRYDLTVGVSYAENLDHVIRVLKKTLTDNSLCLDEPAPLVVFTGFGASSCDFLIGAWCRKEDYDELRTSLSREIKEAFDKEGIEIPFPHTVVTMGKAATPIKVEMVTEERPDNLADHLNKPAS